MTRGRARAHEIQSVELRPANPFQLIQLLARSQPDPRKAIAELVQNSLDAQAHAISIERLRVKRAVTLVIRDDGEGVLPEMAREEALVYIATHVGHSRKLGLEPGERTRRVIAGKYGVGLLGFWAVGRLLELRTRVNGSGLFALELEEESPHGRITPLPIPVDAPPTYTEVVIHPVHGAAQKALSGRRLSDYLATELRGQILAHGAKIVVNDRVARGSAQKRFAVAPKRFTGERLALHEELPVVGHPPIKVELYLSRGAERPRIQVGCSGTLVADDIVELGALGFSNRPWTGCDLTGLVDFSGFTVPPGTRRGVVPNKAAAAFAEAMNRLEAKVVFELERLERERRHAVDRDVVRDLRRALRGLPRRLPQYDLPPVQAPAGDIAENGAGPGGPLDGEPPAGDRPEHEPLPLFPPGPLATVRIVPELIRVPPGSERRVTARAEDADGRRIDGARFSWHIEGGSAAGLALVRREGRASLAAHPLAPLGAEATLDVVAEHGDSAVSASARVIVDEVDDEKRLGIPEPHLVSDAAGTWRSRMNGERWEVNDAHEDYRALRDDARGRLRYVLTLLTREIVLRTTGRTDAADVLDSVVEVLAHAERNLRGA